MWRNFDEGTFPMANVFDVAEFILRERGEMTAMKLQKLVYYSQAWHIAWTDNVLFHNRIEAWKDGPVCPDLWREHANSFRVGRVDKGNPAILNVREQGTVKKVLKFYGSKSPQWLSDLTHSEDPWKDARRGVPSLERSTAEITPASMARYYSSLQ
jgi:uncharacterized phage-associated protein